MKDRPQEQLVDEVLVLRAQAGDERAFTSLVERWQDRLWRHALRLTGEQDTAWDVVQETLLAVSRQLGRLENAAAFPAWAYQIATRKAMDWLRSKMRLRDLQARWLEDAAGERSIGPSQRDTRLVDEVLDLVSPTDRILLTLRYMEGFSTAETARILDIPEGTVKSRLAVLRERMKTLLKGEHHGGS